MRCKVDDLVIINYTAPQYRHFLGQIRQVRERAPSSGPCEVAWLLNPPAMDGDRELAACDEHLTPIRDQPGEDETLQWAPVPGQKVEEAACV